MSSGHGAKNVKTCELFYYIPTVKSCTIGIGRKGGGMSDAGKRIIYLYRDSSYSNIFGDMGRNLLSGEGQAESFQKLRHILAYNIPVMGRA